MSTSPVLRRVLNPAACAFYLAAGVLVLLALFLGGWLAYELIPTVRYHVQSVWSDVHDMLVPHSEVLPTPVPAASVLTPASATPPVTAIPSATPTPGPTLTPSPTPPTPTPVPVRVVLTGFRYEFQKFNNCGPASLAIALSYWGWKGTQADTAAFLKPVQDDKNVSPYNMYEYLITKKFDAYIRVGGDLDTLKRFIAAGYPPLVEKGFEVPNKGWMGHYGTISGYDDARGVFIIQDSYLGANLEVKYADFMINWRAFNHLYMIIFPADAEHDAAVTALLGEAADLNANYRTALAQAQGEVYKLTGQDAAFAWFNVGTNLMYLKDYAGAATAYDEARKIGLPYRMLWYQIGPYRSYYQMARYQDVIDLATAAINSTPVPGLEDSFYWRGQAEEALGQRDKAVADYRAALKYNPNFKLATEALTALGETP